MQIWVGYLTSLTWVLMQNLSLHLKLSCIKNKKYLNLLFCTVATIVPLKKSTKTQIAFKGLKVPHTGFTTYVMLHRWASADDPNFFLQFKTPISKAFMHLSYGVPSFLLHSWTTVSSQKNEDCRDRTGNKLTIRQLNYKSTEAT